MVSLERQESGAVDYEWMALWMGGGLLLAAWTHPFWRELYPLACPLKSLAGLPCAFCGGTRAAAAMAHGHFQEGLALNPLVGVGCLLAALYLAYAVFSVATRQPRRLRLTGLRPAAPPALRWTLRAGILALILANWAYLIAVGR